MNLAEICYDKDLPKPKKKRILPPKKKDKEVPFDEVLFPSISISDVIQGNLRDCSFFAALASILNLENGQQYIYQAIPYYNKVKIKY